MTPSLKTIAAAFPHLDETQVKKVKGLMDGSVDPGEFESVRKWVAECWHKPSRFDRRLKALNELLEGHGVIDILGPNDEMRGEYINTGDIYNATIVYSYIHQSDWFVTTVGDFVETAERRGYRFK